MKLVYSNEMLNLPVIVFPHPHLPEASMKRILSFFGPVTIFQPWFMERPDIISGTDESTRIRILNPPDSCNPGETFPRLLAEYREWIKHHADRSYIEFIKAGQETEPSENTTWEIRQMVLGSGSQGSDTGRRNALRWHLILHLAMEFEEQRAEADRLLKALKGKNALLEGLIGDETQEVDGLLEDLPSFASDPLTKEYLLRAVIDAWFSLFGETIQGDELLITLNTHLVDDVFQLWEDFKTEDAALRVPVIRFKIPDLAGYSLESLGEIKQKHFNNKKIRELENLLMNFTGKAMGNPADLDQIAGEAERSFPWELSREALNVTVKHLPGPSNIGSGAKDEVLKHLYNKTLIFIGDTSFHE